MLGIVLMCHALTHSLTHPEYIENIAFIHIAYRVMLYIIPNVLGISSVCK